MHCQLTYINLVHGYIILQVIKNIRNVTRHRNGQSLKSRQTRWEWQLLISIMHIHAVVTRYNNCAFLCEWHVNIMVFFALLPCCVDESYSRVCVLVDVHAIILIIEEIKSFCTFVSANVAIPMSCYILVCIHF